MPGSTVWRVRGHHISLTDPVIMGILNVTPDSFSDGGAHFDPGAAVGAGHRMIDQGAALVDVGGESTRPNADPVPVEEELRRVLPVIEQLAADGVVVSVDTRKPQVAQAAIDVGAAIVNDITGLTDPEMQTVCGAAAVGVVIMHMQGDPKTMQEAPSYGNVVSDVGSFLVHQALAAEAAGVPHDGIAIDPGIGFGKTFEHNIDLMSNLDALTDLGYPVLLGTSRKGFLGTILGPIRGATKPTDRDGATAATLASAVFSGVRILRVHNVPLGVDVAMTAKAMVPKRSHDEEADRT